MFSLIARWWQERIIRRSTVTGQQWQLAFARLPLLNRLTKDEKARLTRLAILFLHEKSLEGARGLELTSEMKLTIALQACLPVLNLGLDWYRGWVSVIVYPAQFIPERNFVDEFGVEHSARSVLSGESWHRGPVILSWEGARLSGVIDGYNLVIHEFAHKLDVLNGDANGFPPLHRNMDVSQWVTALTEAYNDFQNRLNTWNDVPIDSYAAASPAEFFAVFSEVFFERPDILNHYYPAVYEQFKQFYRQDPIVRLPD
ncbi:MAG: zinc-dependent peptidase [Gammaproteobacteria bacterium]|nr:zinc-dependent peptidase [Gammaproteobacteria bacterium]